MDKAVAQGTPPTYTELDLPDETRNYVPKLQAIKNIIARPAKYGITLPKVSNAPYFTTVHKTRDMDIAVAAALAEMPLEDFRALNPSYNQPVILGQHNPALHLPLDKVAVFNDNLASYTGRLSSWQTYHPRQGESLAAIAKSHGITLDQLRDANKLGPRQTKATMATLLIPGQTGTQPKGGLLLASFQRDTTARSSTSAAAPTRAARADLRPRAAVRTHTIRPGDTLYTLARRYNTSVDALRKLNNLKGSSLSTGQRLRVPGTDIQG
jgi:membrane-bound lytic murein transglycosylase D